MSLITVDQLREHIETDMSDDALQRLADDAEAEIISKYGPHTSQVEPFLLDTAQSFLYLSRPVDAITSVVETVDGVETTLAADDYELVSQWRRINRLGTGTHGRTYWGEKVVVTYAVTDENAERTGVIIDIVKLEVEYTGNKSDDFGDVKMTRKDVRRERKELMSRLAGRSYA